MKEVTEIMTMQVTKVMKVSDAEADIIVSEKKNTETAEAEDAKAAYDADDVTAQIKYFVRDLNV